MSSDFHADHSSFQIVKDYFLRELEQAPDRSVVLVIGGDYSNNGLKSIETLLGVLKLGKEYPRNVVLLSGNHEGPATFRTATKEFGLTHWKQFQDFSRDASPGSKPPPLHYGNLRLDICRKFGITIGERVYKKFAEWGRSLPLFAVSDKGVLISHSLGIPGGMDGTLTRSDLDEAKNDTEDTMHLWKIGYESWKAHKVSIHSVIVNFREITPAILDVFARIFDVRVFCVGHSHFRSGDRERRNPADPGTLEVCEKSQCGEIVTICSSDPSSADSGNYIRFEFEIFRPMSKESRVGTARACIVRFDFDEGVVNSITHDHVLYLTDL